MGMSWLSLITVAALIEYFVFVLQTGQARGKYKVKRRPRLVILSSNAIIGYSRTHLSNRYFYSRPVALRRICRTAQRLRARTAVIMAAPFTPGVTSVNRPNGSTGALRPSLRTGYWCGQSDRSADTRALRLNGLLPDTITENDNRVLQDSTGSTMRF